MNNIKTIVLLNLRFSDFYSQDLFKRVKEEKHVRFVAIVDQYFKDKIGAHIAPYLDHVYLLSAQPKNGFLAEFSYPELQAIIRKEVKNADDLHIVCTDEFNLLNAGKLRREFGLKGHTDKDLLCYRDKVKMKALLSKAGIRVPRFKLLETADDFDQVVAKIGLPFIVKPVDSCGSHGVHLVRDQLDFDRCKQAMIKDAVSVQVEEFIEGKLYHVDSCIKEHSISFICANEYTYPNYDYTKGKALGSIPLDEHDPHAIRLIHFARKCLKVLGANNLVNHMELFITKNDEIVFLEVSGRPPGAMLNLTHQINFDINLAEEDFFMQTDLTVDIVYNPSDYSAFFALFPLLPGEVVKINQPLVKSEVDMTWHVSIGHVISKVDCESVIGKAAHAIFYNKNKKILRSDFDSVKKHQAIEVK